MILSCFLFVSNEVRDFVYSEFYIDMTRKKQHTNLERRNLIYLWIALTMEIADFLFLDIDILYYTQSKTCS